MVDLVKFADDGTHPVSGGTIDQTDSWLNFYALWKSTRDRLTAETQHG